MKKNPRARSSAVPRVDPYLEGLISKLLERLIGLEKKVDTVIAQTSGRSSAQTPPIPQATPRRDRVLYEAICADCHKVCEVPFKPSEARPVYCKECFAKRKGLPPPGMPVLTPVAMPPKTASKLAVATVRVTPKKTKKSPPAKKTKKKR